MPASGGVLATPAGPCWLRHPPPGDTWEHGCWRGQERARRPGQQWNDCPQFKDATSEDFLVWDSSTRQAVQVLWHQENLYRPKGPCLMYEGCVLRMCKPRQGHGEHGTSSVGACTPPGAHQAWRARADVPGPGGYMVRMCEPLTSEEPGTQTGARVCRGRVTGSRGQWPGGMCVIADTYIPKCTGSS